MTLDLVNLDDDQAEIRQLFGHFFATEIDSARWQRIADGTGFDDELWEAFCSMGGNLVGFDEQRGGSGGSMADAALIALEAGRQLAPVPTWEVLPVVRLLAAAGADDELKLLLDGGVATTLLPQDATGRLHGPFAAVAAIGLSLEDDDVDLVDLAGAEATPNLGNLPLAIVAADASRRQVDVSPEHISRFHADRRMLGAAAIVGAARRALDDVAAYVKEREQFGRPLASLQAIQHRLADVFSDLLAAELLVLRASRAAEGDLSHYSYEAVCAVRVAADVAERCGLEASQFHGGYGFTLEYDVHRQIRFIRAWSALLAPRDEETADVLQPTGERAARYVPIDGTPPTVQKPEMWAELDAFLARHYTDDVRRRVHETRTELDPEFSRALGDAGLVGMTWPGFGAGATPEAQSTYWTHAMYHGTPTDGQKLTETVGSLLLQLGTEEQKRRFLPGIVSGELQVSLGWSEAEAGSDTTAVRTRATRTGDDYLVQGAKMFTTMGHVADYVLLLVRTSGEHRSRQGLSLLLVPTGHPGFEAQEIKTFSGERTNSTFYHDVLVPAENLVGEEDRGFEALMASVNAERSLVSSRVGEVWRVFDILLDSLEQTGATLGPSERVRLSEFRLVIEAAAALADHAFRVIGEVEDPSVLASVTKLVLSESMRRLSYDALTMLGPAGLVSDGPHAPAGGELERLFRHAHVVTIYGGTSEVQRNVIARRGLGLR